MQKHPFDPISFVFGMLFLAVAGFAVSRDSIDSGLDEWLWPAALILVGAVLLASTLGRGRRDSGDEQ